MVLNIKMDVAALTANMFNIADRASKHASRDMRAASIKIRDLARDYAPIKTGALENAIQDGFSRDPLSRRNVFTVFLNTSAPGSDLVGAGRTVGEYALIMEQELHPYGRAGSGGTSGGRYYTLGPGSLMKQASGLDVGGRFLWRAVKNGAPKVFEQVATTIRRQVNLL